MTPGRYTELFFLDEPTALAAGHRPCGECRRTAYRQFKDAFLSANGPHLQGGRDVAAIDRLIATDRGAAQRGEYQATPPAALPDGTMVRQRGAPWLKLGKALLEWSFEGYRQAIEAPSMALEVLTPLSLVRTLAIGYRCDAHSTATPLIGREFAGIGSAQ